MGKQPETPLGNLLEETEQQQYSRKQIHTWTRLRKSPSAMIGLTIILLLVFIALMANYISPQGYNDQDLRKGLFAPSRVFPLGTDELGRDLLSRIIYGSRISLEVAILVTFISAATGVSLGAIAGFYGGRIDTIIQGAVDISWAFPTVLLAIFLVAVLGPSLASVMLAIGLGYWGGFERVVRGQILSLREQEFVLAARALGAKNSRIMFLHLLPNCIAPVIVMATLMLADAILIEATLSFLGMGAQPPTPSWGSILSGGRSYLRLAPWVTIFPGLAIMFTVLGFNLLGDGLRDTLDPRLRNL